MIDLASLDEQKQVNPFDYVTIPVKEYKKLIKAKVRAEQKCKAKYADIIKDLQDSKDMYERWYREKAKSLEEAKSQIAKLLGVDEDAEQA